MEAKTLIQDEELNYIARQFLARYKQKLAEQGSLTTQDKLATGANYHISVEGEHVCLYFDLEDYWKYVEYGRLPGRFPPIDKIADWIRIKPVVPRAGKNGKVPTTKQLAFLISRKIATEGIKPKNTLSNTIQENNTIIAAFANKIQELMAAEFANIIDTEI